MTGVRFFQGQRYEMEQIVEHTCRDGRVSNLEVWVSSCCECGARVEFTKPALSERFSPNRRCQKHKRPGSRVNKKAA